MVPKKPVISIIGTTGVGKSQLSIELALKYNGEVINADSMQMYKGLDNITNKHPVAERFGVVHHVMNHVDWDDEYDMHRFRKEALLLIEDIHSRGKLPIIVGGTHYYLQSVLFNNKTVITNNEELVGVKLDDQVKDLTLEQMAIINGPPENLIDELRKVDPVMAAKFHPNDHRRICRSLEIFYKTGKRASDIYETQRQNDESSLRFKTLFLWVWSEQDVLNERLDTRVDHMLANGALDEIKELYTHYKQSTSLENGVWQVIGFKEFLPWLQDGSPVSESIQAMKTKTRKYSKSQVKWIRNSLCPSLISEQGFANGGEIFLLDATDLTHWIENVNARSMTICDDFLNNNTTQVPHTPLNLESMIPLESQTKVTPKHYHCETCKDKDGNPLVILLGQWELHLQGSKHKSTLKKGKRKREYEEWLRRKKLDDNN